MLKFVDLYNTIQGEGSHVGQQAIFFRLANCNLDCKFCDTNYTDNVQTESEDDIALRILDLHRESVDSRYGNIVFTGGEPMLQDLTPLLSTLEKISVRAKGGPYQFKYFVESNGLLHKPWVNKCFLTISPKTPIAKLHPESLRHAQVLKFLWGQRWPKFFDPLPPIIHKSHHHFYLQPIEDRDWTKNKKEAAEYCMRHPRFKFSLQIHKILGLK